jgi:hypothetical protein
MPKLTDYVREGFRKRRRPWEGTELPEWWNILVWVALAAVCGMLALSAIFDDGPGSGATQRRRPYVVQTVDPYPKVTAPSPSGTPGRSRADFSTDAPVRVAKTGGGTAVVPAGARNVALAGANAEATGVWSGIPLTGAMTPGTAPRTPHGRVIGDITVQDPALTGTGSYVFSATITHDAVSRSYRVRITVGRTPRGYAVLAHD